MYEQTLLGSVKPFALSFGRYVPNHADYFAHPEQYRVDPFSIYGNLYYVGDRMACPHLIDTGDGLILLDTGYGHEEAYLLENIRTLGFRVEDVKIIVHTHGHYDHFGCTETIRKLSGAKVYMSRVDTQLLREMPERALVMHSCVPGAAIPWPDVELEDGDHIRLGNTDIRCVLSPGHTLGTMSFFFHATENGTPKRVGYFGGTGFMPMCKAFCAWYHLPLDMIARMKQTIGRLSAESVDITLGNHPYQNNTLGKRQWMLENPGKNPFVDEAAWPAFLGALSKSLLEFEAIDSDL